VFPVLPGDAVIREKDKTIIITGAASGLGRQLTSDMASSSSNLVLADLNEKELEGIAADVQNLGARTIFRRTDVTSETECSQLISDAVKEFGQIDILITCAGISMWAPFETITDLSIFHRLIEVNFYGVLNCLHPALPELRKTSGTVVTITSLQGELGIPQHTGYAAAKHAVNGMLESLEFELNDEVRILNVMPGWITGTNLRANALQGDGSKLGQSARKHSKEAVSVQECSQLIIEALERGQRHLFIPKKLKYLAILKLLAPGLVRRLIVGAVKKTDKLGKERG